MFKLNTLKTTEITNISTAMWHGRHFTAKYGPIFQSYSRNEVKVESAVFFLKITQNGKKLFLLENCHFYV